MHAFESVSCILALAALILTIFTAMGKVPGWIPMIFLCIIELLQCMPR